MDKKTKTGDASLIKKLTEELMALIGIKAKVDINKLDDGFLVNIDPGNETGLLIGYHGETLASLQSFLGMAVRCKTGEWSRINLDVGGYREKQEQGLIDLAKQAAERARSTNEPQTLYNLNPSQRRVVHLALSKEKDLETESFGEGEGRYLIIRPKTK